jgi:hypothetical protein
LAAITKFVFHKPVSSFTNSAYSGENINLLCQYF